MVELGLSFVGLLALVLVLVYFLARKYQVNRQPVVIISLVILAGLTIVTYGFIGQPGLVVEQQQQKAFQQSTQTLVDQLAARLAKEPNNFEGWLMLGHSYGSLGQWALASQAFEKAYQLDQNSPDAMIGLAESLAEQEMGVFNLRAQALVATARQIAADQPEVLWVSAMVARQQGDLDQVIDDLSLMRVLLLKDSEEFVVVTNLLKNLEKVRQDAKP